MRRIEIPDSTKSCNMKSRNRSPTPGSSHRPKPPAAPKSRTEDPPPHVPREPGRGRAQKEVCFVPQSQVACPPGQPGCLGPGSPSWALRLQPRPPPGSRTDPCPALPGEMSPRLPPGPSLSPSSHTAPGLGAVLRSETVAGPEWGVCVPKVTPPSWERDGPPPATLPGCALPQPQNAEASSPRPASPHAELASISKVPVVLPGDIPHSDP